MSWIHEVPEDTAEGEIAALYGTLRETRGKVSNILKVHSLRPAALQHHLDLYMGLLFAPGGLSRAEREMVAVVVSRANGCDYCVEHHLEALRRYLRDESQLALVAADFRKADLKPRQRAMLDYAQALTLQPASIQQHDIEDLRSHGLADADILLLNLIVAYFNFVNRIALGLGVHFDPEEVGGYKV